MEVNLSSEKITKNPINDNILENFLGGRGIGIKLFTERVKKEIDPLKKENLLIISLGPVKSEGDQRIPSHTSLRTSKGAYSTFGFIPKIIVARLLMS